MTVRRSPQLARLPRREINDTTVVPQRVKLRTSMHKRRSDPHPYAFHELTVPVDMAQLLPPDARFEVTLENGRDLHYRMLT